MVNENGNENENGNGKRPMKNKEYQLYKQCETRFGEGVELSHSLAEGEAELIRDIICYCIWVIALRNLPLNAQTKQFAIDSLGLLEGLLDISLLVEDDDDDNDGDIAMTKTVEENMSMLCCQYLSDHSAGKAQ